ncbi:MAG: response regulator [Acidobacteriia bacterium]|nr:response regulator [Terriglobia bacterium]
MSNDEQQFAPLRELLEHDGYGVWTTWSGREALQEIVSKHFDALVVDDYVPDLYVGQFIEKVSRIPSHPCLILVQPHDKRANLHNFAGPGMFCVVDKAQPTEMAKAMELILQQGVAGQSIEHHPMPNGGKP